jgi:hypothetical protein
MEEQAAKIRLVLELANDVWGRASVPAGVGR